VKKLPGKPKLTKVLTYMVARFKTWLSAYPADSIKAFCEVCNNAIIAKHCELERHNW